MTMKTNNPRSARSLSATLAVAFFSISAVVLLLSGALQIVLNIQIQQAELSARQQVIAQNAAKTVSAFIQDKFNSLQTAVEFIVIRSLLAQMLQKT